MITHFYLNYLLTLNNRVNKDIDHNILEKKHFLPEKKEVLIYYGYLFSLKIVILAVFIMANIKIRTSSYCSLKIQIRN